MSSQNDGIIVILSSPSGAGKTTLVKLLSKKKKTLMSQFLIQPENQEAMRLTEKIIFLLVTGLLKI